MVVVNEMEKLAYSQKKIEKNPWLVEEDKQTVDTKVKLDIVVDDLPIYAMLQNKVPNDLLCPICKELLRDAVMMPCCAGEPCLEYYYSKCFI